VEAPQLKEHSQANIACTAEKCWIGNMLLSSSHNIPSFSKRRHKQKHVYIMPPRASPVIGFDFNDNSGCGLTCGCRYPLSSSRYPLSASRQAVVLPLTQFNQGKNHTNPVASNHRLAPTTNKPALVSILSCFCQYSIPCPSKVSVSRLFSRYCPMSQLQF
jgi:hypothetical protein